ncbi:uncharacterized protein LOC144108026 [Amblyomma americanum]
MMAKLPLMACLLAAWAAVSLGQQYFVDYFFDDACELPWTVPRDAYQDLPDNIFETLMDCPKHYHGCSDNLVSCDEPDAFVVTCSCAPNCRAYEDCCWNVELPERAEEADTSRSSCVEVKRRSEPPVPLKMVVGCPQAWPDNEIRKGCEESESFDEIFYRIPVTGTNHVTYRNGFCALCNSYMASGIFWNTTIYKEGQDAMVSIPDEIFTHPALHLRSCASDYLNDTCPQHVPEDVARKCRMYYAPVEDSRGVAFKNIYCAICNGARDSTLSCRQKRYEVNRGSHGTRNPPNLAAIFKTVKRTPTCLAEYNGRCYINLDTDGKRLYKDRNFDFFKNLGDEDEISRHYDVEHYLTVICISLSIGCLLLKIIVFCAYKKSRSFSSKCTLCLAFTLVFTHLVFLITNCISLTASGCVVGGVLVHYGFLSTFFWTSALSYDIYKSLTAVKLSSTRDSKLAVYGLYSWGLPLVITAAAFTVDRTLPGTVLSPSYGSPICWIGTFWSLVLYFLAPVAVLLLFCLLFYFKSVAYIRQTSSATGSAPREQEHSGGAEKRSTKQRNYAALFVRLAMIMCSPWAVAFVGTFVDSKAVDCIVNSLVGLQGAYLFFAFRDYRYFLSCMQKPSISAFLMNRSGSSQERLAP